jgi:hypothetical protein
MNRIRANTARHIVCGSAEALEWYEDAQLRCRRCLVIFSFTAEEQQYWYEDLRFLTDSRPSACPACRHFYRRIKGADRFVEQVQTGVIPADAPAFGHMAEIAALRGQPTKAATLLRRAVKLGLPAEERARLDTILHQATSAPELLERAVPDITYQPRAMMRDLVVVVLSAYQDRSLLAPAVRAALERIHETKIGMHHQYYFNFKLRQCPAQALQRLERFDVAESPEQWHRINLKNLLMVVYPALGEIRLPGQHRLPPPARRLIDTASHALARYDWQVAQQTFAAAYPIEMTPWGGDLVPYNAQPILYPGYPWS